MGLENYPSFRQGGRLENYSGEKPFSAAAFTVLTRLIKSAAENLAEFDAAQQTQWTLTDRALAIMTLCFFTLEELASAAAPGLLQQKRLDLQATCSS